MEKCECRGINLGILSDYRSACYGFCALWIVLFHARMIGCDFSFGIDGLSAVNAFLSLGNFGVDVFMLLSGISCYFSWTKRNDAAFFLRKRLVRIAPSVLVICGFFWTAWVLMGGMHWTRLLYNATLVLPIFSDGSQGVWYVAAILMLYAAYPYIHAAIYGFGGGYSEKKLFFRTGTLCALLLFGFWMLHKYNLPLFRSMEIMAARVPTFCIGSYLGHFVKERRMFGALTWPWVIAASVAYIAYAVMAFSWVEGHFWWWRVTMIPGGVIGALLICRLFSLLDGVFAAKPVMAFFCLTGEFSLELYVTHIMCFWSHGLLPPIEGGVPIALGLSCLSWLTAFLVNRFLYVWFDGGVLSLILRCGRCV